MMTERTVMIVDDEPLARRRLEVMLKAVPAVRLVATAANRQEAVQLIRERRPDILLLDVRLRDGTGFDILDELPGHEAPAVVFVTAFDHFAIKAFEVAAADYLLKPIEPARLEAAILRARDRIAADVAADELAEMRLVVRDLRSELHAPGGSPYTNELWIRGATGNLTNVSFDHVLWVSSEEDYVRLHTDHGSHLVRMSIKALAERIDPDRFVRVHRKALVKLSAINQLRQSPGGRREILLRDGTRVPAGRIYAKRLRDMLRDHISR